MVEESRKKIIEGLQELRDCCNGIPNDKCHNECPFEDICLMLRCVGMGSGVRVFPCNWKLERLRK